MNKEEAKRKILEKLKIKLEAIDENRDLAVSKIIKEQEEAELKEYE